jgi:hypothetical protein
VNARPGYFLRRFTIPGQNFAAESEEISNTTPGENAAVYRILSSIFFS